jgi:sterol desaturase/sphingolipid hydroxylase (fatty acid hydroxylase superfamily)
MFYIYLSKTPFFERYRVDPDRPWPWEDPQQFSKFLPKVVQSISLEILLQTLIIMVATYLPVDFRYDLESFPTKWQIIWQVGFFMLTDDFFFYWAHRVMHMPYFYKRFHKQHHEFQTSVTIATVIFL